MLNVYAWRKTWQSISGLVPIGVGPPCSFSRAMATMSVSQSSAVNAMPSKLHGQTASGFPVEPAMRGSQELPLAADDVGVTPTTPSKQWLRTTDMAQMAGPQTPYTNLRYK
jgi:hypothetical protein